MHTVRLHTCKGLAIMQLPELRNQTNDSDAGVETSGGSHTSANQSLCIGFKLTLAHQRMQALAHSGPACARMQCSAACVCHRSRHQFLIDVNCLSSFKSIENLRVDCTARYLSGTLTMIQAAPYPVARWLRHRVAPMLSTHRATHSVFSLLERHVSSVIYSKPKVGFQQSPTWRNG
ncbi:hypothetical protein TWF225_003323 [Orbilia oligospora]|nr:hypothetical protein TWF225_003323 [Orbilia oligospora]